MINQPNSVPLRVHSGGENLNNFMKRVENECGLSISKSASHHVEVVHNNDDSGDDDDDVYYKNIERQTNRNFVPGGASVIMKKQPNSLPLQIQSGGETMHGFMKRVENERGLSMSKSDIEHLEIKFPVRKDTTSDQSKKKRS
ncbi:unnamed protein product, partial [Rotaria sp. Silwood1]